MSRKANEFSKLSQVYFRVGLKELTEVINWLSSSPLDEVAPTQSSWAFVKIRFWSVVVREKFIFDIA